MLIKQTFARLNQQGAKALIPYITPEFPVRGTTVPVLNALADAGADLIEVGIPFSDPLADGRTIQESSEMAIRNGATIATILDAVRQFKRAKEVPIVLMGYMNPILRFGLERFANEAAKAGVGGLIVPDLPPEEAEDLKKACETYGLSNVFLIAPTTSDERIRMIDGQSSDFSYCVSMTGVTGAREMLGSNGTLSSFLQRVRKNAKKPFVVGFGISSKEHVSEVWKWADGAVVGSALIDRMKTARTPADAAHTAGEFLGSLRPDHA